MKPDRRFLLADPAHFVALGFGSGLWPKGPGTAGTLAGWLLFPFVKAPLSDPLFGALLVACFLFGIIACERTGRSLGVADRPVTGDEDVDLVRSLGIRNLRFSSRAPHGGGGSMAAAAAAGDVPRCGHVRRMVLR